MSAPFATEEETAGWTCETRAITSHLLPRVLVDVVVAYAIDWGMRDRFTSLFTPVGFKLGGVLVHVASMPRAVFYVWHSDWLDFTLIGCTERVDDDDDVPNLMEVADNIMSDTLWRFVRGETPEPIISLMKDVAAYDEGAAQPGAIDALRESVRRVCETLYARRLNGKP